VVLGPGEMALCHQTDEWCSVARIEQAVEPTCASRGAGAGMSAPHELSVALVLERLAGAS